MLHLTTRLARLTAIFFLALVAAGAQPGVSGAQDDATPETAETMRITVAAVLCTDAGCTDLGDRLDGFEISVLDSASGDVLDTCVTAAATQSQACALEIPADTGQYEFRWADAQVPEGYAWFGSVINVEDGPLGPITYIPFQPLVIEEPGHPVVQAVLCTDASCNAFAGYLDDFVISAVDPESGEEFSSCATNNAQQGLEHQCILDVPHAGDFELVWFDDQVPDGYTSYGAPFEAGESGVLTLGFVPEDAGETPVDPAPTDEPDDVTGLPTTGTGGALEESDSRPTPLVVLSIVVSVGLGLLLVRDATRRRG